MADVNRGNRPLSPHLSVYRPQWTSATSILHRITGVAMAPGAALIVWWLLAAATSEDAFELADGILTSWIGYLILLGLTWSLCYHFLNGIRHLWWDTGRGFDLEKVELSAKLTVAGSLVLTVLIWAVA